MQDTEQDRACEGIVSLYLACLSDRRPKSRVLESQLLQPLPVSRSVKLPSAVLPALLEGHGLDVLRISCRSTCIGLSTKLVPGFRNKTRLQATEHASQLDSKTEAWASLPIGVSRLPCQAHVDDDKKQQWATLCSRGCSKGDRPALGPSMAFGTSEADPSCTEAHRIVEADALVAEAQLDSEPPGPKPASTA